MSIVRIVCLIGSTFPPHFRLVDERRDAHWISGNQHTETAWPSSTARRSQTRRRGACEREPGGGSVFDRRYGGRLNHSIILDSTDEWREGSDPRSQSGSHHLWTKQDS